MTSIFRLLDDRELIAAIDRLGRLIEKLSTSGTWIGREKATHYRDALEEAQAEQRRRQEVRA
jgi:hypothetical protein